MASDLEPSSPKPSDSSGELPAVVPHEGEVAVSVQPEGLLVAGDPSEIEAYVERVRGVAGRAIGVMGVDKTTLGNATGLAAGAASFLGQSAKFVQLHPESLKAIQKDQLIKGTGGFYRMMTRGADKKFVSQLQWKPVNLTPVRMMSLQMVAVQMALKSAIAEVEESVQRVEGKVEEVLRLAHANRSGDVLGDRVTIDRMAAYLDRHGSFSDADWDSIAGIGPALNRTVEQLRHHADRTLQSFDPTKPIQDRADFIVKAVDNNQLGETLSLLVVSQESLFKWQRLRLARVEATQPEHVQQVLDDARDLLARQLVEDDALFQRAKGILDAVAKTEAIDGFRFWSVQGLQRSLPMLRADLDRFGKARRAHMQEWQEFKAPTARDAANAAVERVSDTATVALGVASDTATMALGAASEGIDKLGGLLGRARGKSKVWRREKPNADDD
ncbi:type 1 glutamine amidotransferase family protein, partial [Mycolicibacterium mageritense]